MRPARAPRRRTSKLIGPIATTPFVTYQRSPDDTGELLLGGKTESGATSRNDIMQLLPSPHGPYMRAQGRTIVYIVAFRSSKTFYLRELAGDSAVVLGQQMATGKVWLIG